MTFNEGARRYSAFLLALIAVLAFMLGACSDDDGDDAGSRPTQESSDDGVGTPSTGAILKLHTRQIAAIGTVLTTSTGRTLYTFANDPEDTSACDAACAAIWPPYIIEGTPYAGPGIPGELGTIDVEQGQQLTYNRKPLYLYANDTAAGQTNGQGIDPAWSVATP